MTRRIFIFFLLIKDFTRRDWGHCPQRTRVKSLYCRSPWVFIYALRFISHCSVLVEIRPQPCSTALSQTATQDVVLLVRKCGRTSLRDQNKLPGNTIIQALLFIIWLFTYLCALYSHTTHLHSFLCFITDSVHKMRNIIRVHANVATAAANNACFSRC